MVKKKGVKKISKRKTKKVVLKRKVSKKSKPVATKNKFKLAVRQLIFFAVLTLITYSLYAVANKEMYVNLFFLLSTIFGFVTLAFLIVLLILFFMKNMKK